jgi:hypothetical protein
MSHEISDTYEVYNEKGVVARKEQKCSACDEAIRPGDRYTKVFIVFEREVESLKRCARCQKIHEHLRGIEPYEQWPDEKLKCGMEYKEHWGREPPLEIAALAFALPGDVE